VTAAGHRQELDNDASSAIGSTRIPTVASLQAPTISTRGASSVTSNLAECPYQYMADIQAQQIWIPLATGSPIRSTARWFPRSGRQIDSLSTATG
jgi:hypothetical protein